jgi:hypothetical protein
MCNAFRQLRRYFVSERSQILMFEIFLLSTFPVIFNINSIPTCFYAALAVITEYGYAAFRNVCHHSYIRQTMSRLDYDKVLVFY